MWRDIFLKYFQGFFLFVYLNDDSFVFDVQSSETLTKRDRPEATVESDKNENKSQIEQDQNKQEKATDDADTIEEKGEKENEETVDEKCYFIFR